MWFRQHARPRTQTEHSSHREQYFCLCQRCDTCPNVWQKCVFFFSRFFGSYLKHVQILWWRSCSKCYAINCFGTYLKHVQTSDDVRVQSATQSTASVQTWNMSKSCDDVRFQTAIRNRLLRYRLETCPNLVMTFVFKPLYAIDCFGTDLKHVQTCDDVRVPSATQSTASVQTWNMSKSCDDVRFQTAIRNRLLRYRLETCPNLWWRACSKCYAINCFGTYLNMSKPVMTFVFKVLRNRLLRYRLETCPNLVMTFVFKVLRNRLLRYRLETCPNLWWRACSKCYAINCFGTGLKHVQILWWRSFSNRYTQSTASVQTWNMSKPVMTCVFKVLRNRLLRLETCPNLVMTFVFKPLYAIDCFGTDLKHVQTCDDVRVQSATQSTASVHTWNMSKPVMTFVFKVLRNRLLRYRLETCPNLWWPMCSKCYAIDCFGTWNMFQTCGYIYGSFTHVHWHLSGSLVAYALQPCKTMYILYIATKYLWELRDSERAQPRTRNVVV